MLANSTSARRRKISAVPLPWWTSQSRTNTRSRPCSRDRSCGRHGDVVEQAEAHRALALGVMAGGPDPAEADLGLAGEQRADHLTAAPAACRAASIRGLARRKVSGSIAPPRRAQLADGAHVALGVDELELRLARRRRLAALPAQPVPLGRARARASPGARACRDGPARTAGIVGQARRVAVEQGAHRALTWRRIWIPRRQPESMRAMVFERVGPAAARRPSCRSRARPGAGAAARARLRGLPHRPAPARRRGRDRRHPPRVLGHQIVGDASRAPASEPGRARRRAVARLDRRRRAATAARAARTCARRARFTGCDIDGGYRRVRRRRRALLLPDPRGLPRRAGRAAAVRRADRLPRAAHVRRRASGSASTASAPRRTSSPRWRRWQGRRGVRLHAPRRRRGRRRSRASSAPSGRAARTSRRPSRSTRRSSSRPVGALVPAALRALAPGGDGRVRRHPHERHPVVPLRAAVGGALAALGRQPHPRATARSSSRWRPQVPVRTDVTHLPARARPTRRSTDLRAGRFTGAAVIVP